MGVCCWLFSEVPWTAGQQHSREQSAATGFGGLARHPCGHRRERACPCAQEGVAVLQRGCFVFLSVARSLLCVGCPPNKRGRGPAARNLWPLLIETSNRTRQLQRTLQNVVKGDCVSFP